MIKSKRFYAVQVGDNYNSDCGSHNYKEARKMATEMHRAHLGSEVRIAFVTDNDDYTDAERVIYEGKN